MNIDEAINKAADHIEQYPESYNFGQGTVINKDYGGPSVRSTIGPGGYYACMLARIGEMAGMQAGLSCDTVARDILGTQAEEFYSAIRAASPYQDLDPVHNTKTIPAAMRTVAKRYTGIPVQVREIFNVPTPVTATLVTRYRTERRPIFTA